MKYTVVKGLQNALYKKISNTKITYDKQIEGYFSQQRQP
jgi:hypothetical protein